MKFFWIFCLTLLVLLYSGQAQAAELAQKLAQFPQWEKLTSPKPAIGDLIYPDWMAGDWLVTSTLVDLAAPLAPDIVTPGFEGNRQYLHQPVQFQVRFVTQPRLWKQNSAVPIVADRAFNGLSLARAYLGDRAVVAVKVDPDSPNRQITILRGDRQLVSIVTERSTETNSDARFITCEVFQQLFKGGYRPYFNRVESTTAYQKIPTSHPDILADQFTAVYPSPQDPEYFAAGSRPVALYRYRLEFQKLLSAES